LGGDAQMSSKHVLHGHFVVEAEVYRDGGGLGIFVKFGNLKKGDSTPEY